MRLIFKCSTENQPISIEINVNPEATIQDIINILKTNEQINNRELELLYRLSPVEPQTNVTALRAQENDVFLIRFKSPQTSEPKTQKKKGYGLPPRTGVKVPTEEDDPPSFAADVAMLMEMGFEKEKCEKALRVSFYNPDRATLYLVEGNIPDRAGPEDFGLAAGESKPKSLLDQFNKNDIEVINKLAAEFNMDRVEVSQYYLVNGKDYEKTKNCISPSN